MHYKPPWCLGHGLYTKLARPSPFPPPMCTTHVFPVRKRTSFTPTWKAFPWGGLVRLWGHPRSTGTAAPHQTGSFGTSALGLQTVVVHKVGASKEVLRTRPLGPQGAQILMKTPNENSRHHTPKVIEQYHKPTGTISSCGVCKTQHLTESASEL